MNREQTAARLLGIFIGELEEQLESLNRDLLTLEKTPTDANGFRSVFRIVHSLKGAASAANVPLIARVCHKLESMLATARDTKAPMTKAQFALLFSAADALDDARKKISSGLELTGSPLAALDERLEKEARNAGASPSPNLESASPPPGSTPSNSPTLGGLKPPGLRPLPQTPASRDHLEKAPVPRAGQVRIETEKVDSLLARANQLRRVAGRIQTRSEASEEIYERADRWRREWEASVVEVRRSVAERASAGPMLRALDELEARLRLLVDDTRLVATQAREDGRSLASDTAEVVEGVRRLRLRPFSDACLALPRIVRDIAGSEGKEVRLEILGREVQADRDVLDLLDDVLLQLVRNAVDHGIETPAERVLAGKPGGGVVRVEASSTGQRLRIKVSDDGCGLDLDAVSRQLKLRGMPIPSDREELGRSILRPGFSTRGVATSTSGRGVGLDIVVNKLAQIAGSVQVEWAEGGGTTFILECSPALSVTHALVVRVGTQLIAIPSAHVRQLAVVGVEEIRRAEGKAVILTDGGPVVLASLAKLLGPPLQDEKHNGTLHVVHLAASGQRLAVVVNEHVADEEITIRALPSRSDFPFLIGASVLQSGRLCLVLNSAEVVLEGARRGTLEPTFASSSGAEAPKRVLVVDDSITTRTLEQSILEAAGFAVTTAVDGQDAWTLIQEQPFDLVVSDVEMPRMDGVSLCEMIRATERFASLPVVLVTALDAPEHRSRGMRAGADAYLPKTSFDHQDLLDTIQQLLD